jgi:TRAP-type uncharacterized transport system substrate-binding protein
MRTRRLIAFASILLAWTMLAAVPSFAAKKEFFAIATGGTGGTYYPLGGILAQALTDKVPDIIVTAQAGNASVANCNLIGNRQIESAFIQSNIAYSAYNAWTTSRASPSRTCGSSPRCTPRRSRSWDAPTPASRPSPTSRKTPDPGDRGSGTEIDCKNVLEGLGLSYKDFSSTDWLSFSGASQRLKDKQADVTFTTAGWPTAAITELAMTSDITLIPLDERPLPHF